ncbi:hypothetical protein SAMN02745165_02073 [Malonomonas rubra DSM 5091]|uniref:Uncharacterized protein n=1 Tax=Malonomonas rubra DSM 5091 TaxID=1122189 RepID=A0A1M6I9N1_MALRU|nr:hypothetical protein [Malonomonas rubra]SHJ31113.1 hypothetical protein SAMN02745165_02073 [Malonomonas rubra DSM 5091]
MKTIKMIVLAMLLAFVTVTLAQAGTQVAKGQIAPVKVTVKNAGYSTMAAVKMTAYDNAGSKAGQLCKEVYLRGYGNTTAVEYSWQAPNYATGLFWQAKVEKNGECPNVEVPTVDPVPSHDSDSDSDDGAYDYHH